MDFSYVHIRYFIGYVYHICLQDTIQSTLSLCLLCQAMLLPMPLRPLLLTTRSGFSDRPYAPHSASLLHLHITPSFRSRHLAVHAWRGWLYNQERGVLTVPRCHNNNKIMQSWQ